MEQNRIQKLLEAVSDDGEYYPPEGYTRVIDAVSNSVYNEDFNSTEIDSMLRDSGINVSQEMIDLAKTNLSRALNYLERKY